MNTPKPDSPLARLRHHVTGAIERGEAQVIVEQPAAPQHEWGIYEKKNPHALHGIFSTREAAARNIREVKPAECTRGLFMDKTLTPDCFEVRPIARAQA
jgi:hypothetical protein